MVGTKRFRVELLTPQWSTASGECTFAVLPAWDGEIGILAGRAPLVCRLGPGELVLEVSGRREGYYLDGGFARMAGNELTVLADRAWPSGEVSEEAARSGMAEARGLKAVGEQGGQARVRQMARARAQLAIVRRRQSAK